MNVSVFFQFSSNMNSSTIQAHPLDENIDDGKLIKGDFSGVKFPVVFKQEYGKKFNDILGTGYAGFYIISDRMKAVMEENKLTGWKTFPIKFYDKKKNEIFGYFGFSVIGKSGPTVYDNCEIIEKKTVPNGSGCKFYKGVVIDRWDGSDFFTPEGTYETFVTKKAADILEKNKITNMHLKNLADSEINVNYVKKLIK